MNNQSVRTSAKNAPGFIFYQSYYEALSQLKLRQRHAVLDAILEYAFTGVKPELPATSSAILAVILPNVESCQKRYKGAVEKAKKSADTAADESQENHEENKEPCENKSKAQKSEICEKLIIEKEKDKEKEKEKDMDKRVYTDKEKETESEAASKSAPETPAPQNGVRRTSPSVGDTHASQRELSMKIISEYAGGDSELRALLESWLDIKKQRSQPINPESIRLNLEELTRITAGSDKKAYMREVIRRGWGTFFELEKKPFKQGGGKDCKSGKNTGGAKGIKPGGYSISDWGEDCESSFDIEEFDRFTLGL